MPINILKKCTYTYIHSYTHTHIHTNIRRYSLKASSFAMLLMQPFCLPNITQDGFSLTAVELLQKNEERQRKSALPCNFTIYTNIVFNQLSANSFVPHQTSSLCSYTLGLYLSVSVWEVCLSESVKITNTHTVTFQNVLH